MFRGKSVPPVPFEKVLLTLGVGFEEIVAGARAPARMFEEMPKKVKEALHLLKEYAWRTKASLYLIGSRAKREEGTRADWDFAIPVFLRARGPTILLPSRIGRRMLLFPIRLISWISARRPIGFVSPSKKTQCLWLGGLFEDLSGGPHDRQTGPGCCRRGAGCLGEALLSQLHVLRLRERACRQRCPLRFGRQAFRSGI